MSKEFNYQRANVEWATPQYGKLPPHIHDLWNQVVDCAEYLGQDKSRGVPFKSRIDEPEARQAVEELERAFDACDPDDLATAAAVIYFWGHWAFTQAVTVHYPGLPPKRFESDDNPFSPNMEAKAWVKDMDKYPPTREKDVEFVYDRVGPNNTETCGAYWKFQHLVKTNLIARKEWTHERHEKQVQKQLGFDTDDFMDHKPDTDYSLDEMPKLFQPHFNGTFEVTDAIPINFKPHPFVIGTRHMPTDGGMFLDPKSAPCAMKGGCSMPYDKHTCDRVLVLKCLRDVPNREAAETLKSVEKLLSEHKLDGFVFVESGFEILPPEDKE